MANSALMDPLRGNTSLSRVIWLYGLVGSLLYGVIALFVPPGDENLMRLYVIGGFIYGVYVTLATYRCARNSRSQFTARCVRVSALVTLLLLPVLTYLELKGELTLELPAQLNGLIVE